MDIEYIEKKKLCPLMSDSKGKVYCTNECSFVTEHYEEEPRKLIGITCGIFSFEDVLESINEKMGLILETK